MNTLRILIADDHILIRRGIRTLLESHAGWEVCGEATTGGEAINKAKELKPDIVVLDIGMPEMNGPEAAKRIRKESPNTDILILSVHYSDQLIREIIEAGARGYVLKSDSDRDLLIAVETIARHKPYFTSQAREVIQSESTNSSGPVRKIPQSFHDRITSREREVIQLLSEG